MKKEHLVKILSEAISDGSDIQVEVTIPGQNDTEYIINKNKSITNKLQYYCDTYDDDLIHKKNPQVKIIGIKKINTFQGISYLEDKEIECENCGQKFYVNKQEKREYGEYGIPYVICPKCNEKAYIYDEKCLDITPENIKFPQYFASFGDKGSVHVENNRVEEWVKTAFNHLLKNKDEAFYQCGSGDTTVIALNYDDQIEIIVAQKYFSYSHDKEE